MNKTDQSLLEQMRITDFEISSRKALFSITPEDEFALREAKPYIEARTSPLVDRFYEMQTAIPEIALLIGDSGTLGRLRNAQVRYIMDLFSGYYDMEYVNNRLRIGLVHKRIGVEPKLYLTAVQTLGSLLFELILEAVPNTDDQARVTGALQKLIMFDISLVFDTYIRSLISEIEISKDKSEQYASVLEQKVKERTNQLEEWSRTDPLTGLLNMRHLHETLTRVLRAAQRRSEPVTVVYIDINDFKIVNDTQGHQRGDEILQTVAKVLKAATRAEDYSFRYGGDEFCVIMPNCTQSMAKTVWAGRVQELLLLQTDSPKLSIGYAQTGPNDFTSAEILITQADQQMYEMKKTMKEALPAKDQSDPEAA